MRAQSNACVCAFFVSFNVVPVSRLRNVVSMSAVAGGQREPAEVHRKLAHDALKF